MGIIKNKMKGHLGSANPQNIDAMVAAGEMTKEEGEAHKKRIAESKKKQKEKKK